MLPHSSQLGVAQKLSRGVTQVLVHFSTYQGSILVPFFCATANSEMIDSFFFFFFFFFFLNEAVERSFCSPETSDS